MNARTVCGGGFFSKIHPRDWKGRGRGSRLTRREGSQKSPFPLQKATEKGRGDCTLMEKKSTTLITCYIFFSLSNFRRPGEGLKGVFLLMINLSLSLCFSTWRHCSTWGRGEKN